MYVLWEQEHLQEPHILWTGNWYRKDLGFDSATFNSMDSVSDRDYLIEYLSALSMIMMHL